MKNESDGFFEITSVHRDDILNEFRNDKNYRKIKKRVSKMTDGEMEDLADYMAEDYCEQLFHDSLKIIFEDIFMGDENEKKK